MAKIHPTSVVMEGAVLADSVEVGPLCYVGPHVQLGEGCRLLAHVNIDGHTTIGKNNTFHPFAALGQPAQDHAVVPGAVCYLKVGDNNIFREGVAIHTGTAPESATEIGNNCMFMNCSHVAHNCKIGNNVIFVNGSVVGGYGQIFDNAILSGLVAIHQFCRVGRFTIISGCSAFSQDVPPFMMAEGRNGGVKMINKVGLTRAGFTSEQIATIKQIFRIYYRSDLTPGNALIELKKMDPTPEVQEFINFIETSKRGVVCHRATSGHRE